MSIRVRLTLAFMGLSMLLLIGTLGYIRTSQEVSRRNEFFDRLRDHAMRLAGLLGELEETDRSVLHAIDVHSIHRLYDEKVLVFDTTNQLIYSSLDDETIPYSVDQINAVRSGSALAYRDEDGDEVVGVHYTGAGQDLVVLASADDKYGRQELRNLTRTLWISLVLGSLFIFGAGYYYVGLVLRPVGRLNLAISNIELDRLDQQLPVRNRNDEIERLALNYNLMLGRLRDAFDLQRAFVNNASHELRTPLARMNAQVEQAIALAPGSTELPEVLRVVQTEISAQASLVESLLLLHRLQAHIPLHRSPVRVDESLFAAIDDVRTSWPDFTVKVDVSDTIAEHGQLTVVVNELLLRTCFRNLLANAAAYSTDGCAEVGIERGDGRLQVSLRNNGSEPLPKEKVFEPFFRGAHPGRTKGNGLGLSIVRSIVEDVGGSVRYEHDGAHVFLLELIPV